MGFAVVRFGYQSTHPLHRCVTSYFISLGLAFPFYKMRELDRPNRDKILGHSTVQNMNILS